MEKKKPCAGVRVIRIVGTVLLSILFFAFLLAAESATAAHSLLSRKAIDNVVQEMDADALAQSTGLVPAGDTLAHKLFTLMPPDLVDSCGLTEDYVQAMLDSREIRSILSEKLSTSVSRVLSGSGDIALTREDILDMLTENDSEIDKIVGRDVTPGDYEEIADILGQEELTVLGTSDMQESHVLLTVRAMLSVTTLAILFLLAAVCCGAIFLVLWDPPKALLAAGITVTVTGFLMVLLSLAVSLALPVLLQDSWQKVGQVLLNTAASCFLLPGIVALAAGVLALTGGILLLARRRRKERASLQQAQAEA